MKPAEGHLQSACLCLVKVIGQFHGRVIKQSDGRRQADRKRRKKTNINKSQMTTEIRKLPQKHEKCSELYMSHTGEKQNKMSIE